MALSKKFQPSDPTNPVREFAKELRLALADKLGLESDEQLDKLKIFTTLADRWMPMGSTVSSLLSVRSAMAEKGSFWFLSM